MRRVPLNKLFKIGDSRREVVGFMIMLFSNGKVKRVIVMGLDFV
jgi:hypothetical protein